MTSIRRNDPCPCGSGKKYKRCCLERVVVPPTAQERSLVLNILHKLATELLADDRKSALDDFWSGIPAALQVPDSLRKTAELTFDGWYYYDRVTANGQTPAEMLLDKSALPDGARAYLERLSGTVMEVWEVVDSSPGASLVLRSSANRRQLTLYEPSASRSLQPRMFVAARVNPVGTSGQPEIDLGCLPIADSLVEPLLARLEEQSGAFEADAAPRAWLKTLPPIFNEVWIRSQLVGDL